MQALFHLVVTCGRAVAVDVQITLSGRMGTVTDLDCITLSTTTASTESPRRLHRGARTQPLALPCPLQVHCARVPKAHALMSASLNPFFHNPLAGTVHWRPQGKFLAQEVCFRQPGSPRLKLTLIGTGSLAFLCEWDWVTVTSTCKTAKP